MNYPIKSSDLPTGLTTDDEQATLIVVEAIMDGSFADIELGDESQRETLLEKVNNWSKFEQYSEMISSQKAILNRPFIATRELSGQSQIDDNFSVDATRIADKAVLEFTKNRRAKSRRNLFSAVSAAALVAFLFIGVTAILSEQNSGTKSSSVQSTSNSDSQPRQNSVESDSITDEKADTEAGQNFTNSNNQPTEGVIKPGTATRSADTPTSIPTPNSESKSSSENVSDTISTLQIVVAFAIAAVLFGLATAFIKLRKNRDSK